MYTQRGFVQIPLLIAIFVGLIIAGGVGYYAVSQKSASQATVDNSENSGVNTDANTSVEVPIQKPTTATQTKSAPSTATANSSASITIANVFTQSVAVQYKNISGKASLQIVNKSGARFDSSSYAQTLISNTTGSLTIALGECTPAGDYYVRAVEQIEQKVSGNEIPYSTAGTPLAQSASFHYNGTPQQSVCDAVSNQQSQGTNSAIVIGPGWLLTTTENPIYIAGTATVASVSIKIINSGGAVVLQDAALAVANNHWRYSPSQTLPVGTYTVSVSGGGNTATGTLKVTAGTPTCTLTLNKPSYQYGETITLSWTSQNATYVAFDQGGSSPAMNLPSGKLAANGSVTVNPSAGADLALLRAYSDTGEGHCIAYPQIHY